MLIVKMRVSTYMGTYIFTLLSSRKPGLCLSSASFDCWRYDEGRAAVIIITSDDDKLCIIAFAEGVPPPVFQAGYGGLHARSPLLMLPPLTPQALAFLESFRDALRAIHAAMR